MIEPVTWWPEITKYDDKIATSITKLVENMWFTRYARPLEITYEKGSWFNGHNFRKSPIEIEYGMTANLSTLVNPTYNVILERIHQVLVNTVRSYNIKEKYLDKAEMCLGISEAAELTIISTENRLIGYSLGQLVFFRDMILLMKHMIYYELIHQQKKKQMKKDNLCENSERFDHDYK